MTTPTPPPDPYGTPPAGGGYTPPPAQPAWQPPAPPPPAQPAQPAWQPPPAAPPAGGPPPAWPQTPAAPPVAGYPAAADPNAAWNQPPAAPGFGNAPAGGRTSFDPKAVNPLDWGIIGAGVLAFLFSLFGFYKAKATINIGTVKQSTSESFSAWHEVFGGGFFGWFAMVFAVAGAVVLALTLFVPGTKIPIPLTARQLVLALFAAATLFEILAIFIKPGVETGSGLGYSFSFGHGFAFWVSLIVIIAGTVLSYLRLKELGEKLPWEKTAA
ncbi:MAG: hypothetical protein JWM76_3369 [Pseudonocardiales bacterium]|nr:hypothetical protein [Pseudonocardiales bacterium]